MDMFSPSWGPGHPLSLSSGPSPPPIWLIHCSLPFIGRDLPPGAVVCFWPDACAFYSESKEKGKGQ